MHSRSIGLFLLLLVATGLSALAQTAAPPSNPRKVLTQADFKKVLCDTTWTWERAGAKPQTLTFASNGNATNNHWVAKYTLLNLHEVTLRMRNKTARLSFAPDHQSFTGIDFNEATKVTGKPAP
jgi:hypothetical protein